MRRATIEDLKRIQIEILDVVVRFCDENQIKYWIDAGTLLGAIRHNGYIPWDDDIDLGMLRPDFDKFIHMFNENNSRYMVKCVETDPTFVYPFAKVLDLNTILYEPDENGIKLNINIDIFVYDNAPDKDSLIKLVFRKRDIYRHLNQVRNIYNKTSNSIISIIKKKIICLFPKNYFTKKIVSNAKRYNHTNTLRVGNFLGWTSMTCEKDVFDSFIEHEFEGKKYKIPVGYHKWLTNYYGDYMKLPPFEKRVSTHTFRAYIE